jgi:hypothetical protein
MEEIKKSSMYMKGTNKHCRKTDGKLHNNIALFALV